MLGEDKHQTGLAKVGCRQYSQSSHHDLVRAVELIGFEED
jgi:hypothetical protein